jgi:branched-chain amino acid aminotransferase
LNKFRTVSQTLNGDKMQNINYLVAEHQDTMQLPEKLEFGKIFTDHLFEMSYNEEKGWHNPTIKKFENLTMSPATVVFHYGQAIFEGLKAFKTVSGDIAIFRPDRHFQRLNNSAKKLCIPEVDVDFCITALKELIKVDQKWVPEKKGNSLYVRPFIFGSDETLGVHASHEYKFYLILSPVGAYYPEGFKPVNILVQDDYVRAVRKGIGECKTPANYAASLKAGEEAKKKGFTQVLWLDGVEQKYLEEVGTMNFFVRFKDEIATPALNGSILPGVTRASVIELLKQWGENVVERNISIDEVLTAYDNGNLVSAFGTGTAAIISAVGSLSFKDKKMVLNNGEPGDLEVKLFDEITDIQLGIKPDTNNWLEYIK